MFWIGDGLCDDKTNIEECQYDGNDCCLEEISGRFCELCFCHQDGTYHQLTTTTTGTEPTIFHPACQYQYQNQSGT